MKIRTRGLKLKIRKNLDGSYPLGGIVLVQILLYLVPFVSPLLAYAAFAVCIYRLVCYDAKVFATDFAVLIPLTLLLRTPAGMSLLSWLALFASMRYIVSGGIRLSGAMAVLIVLANYLLARMQMNISQFVLYFGQLLLICIIITKQNEVSAERCVKYFCLSLFLSSLYAMAFRSTPQLASIRGNEAPAYWGSSFMRFQGLFEDPNYFMLLIILALSLLIKLKDSDRISRSIFLCMGICLTLFGLLTFSKTFALTFGLLACIYIFWQFRKRKYIFGSTVIAVAGTILCLMLVFDFAPLRVILDRFTDFSSISELTTGRTDTFLAYWQLLTSSLASFLFGFGMSADALRYDPHNLYLEIAFHTGIIGLLLLLALFACIVREVNRRYTGSTKQNFYAKYTPLFMMVVIFASLGGMYAIVTGGVYFLSFVSILITKNVE